MKINVNEHGQSIGHRVENWTKREMPGGTSILGRFCRVEPLSRSHCDDLFYAYQVSQSDSDWTYLAKGPFHNKKEFDDYIEEIAESIDPKFYVIINLETNLAVGLFSLMRIDPNNGVIEVGNVIFSPLLKKTTASTEAQYLLMQYVFDTLKYRRYEWKCDSFNAPSKKAAQRLGFTFEGVFRQAVIYKGRSRDTAWFSIIDTEWKALKQVYQKWLQEDNFDAEGKQRHSLESFK